MTTNITHGAKIRIAVPIDLHDDRPISEKQTRMSTVVRVGEDGRVYENEGWVLGNRIGIDWEPVIDEPLAVVIRTTAGPIVGSLTGQRGKLSTFETAAGPMEIPLDGSGRAWDFLKGRSVNDVLAGLPEAFDRASGVIVMSLPGIPPSVCPVVVPPMPEASPEAPKRKKRGPKPKGEKPAPEPTAATLPTVSAADGNDAAAFAIVSPPSRSIVPTFAERVDLALLARQLLGEAETGNLPHIEEVRDRLETWCQSVYERGSRE